MNKIVIFFFLAAIIGTVTGYPEDSRAKNKNNKNEYDINRYAQCIGEKIGIIKNGKIVEDDVKNALKFFLQDDAKVEEAVNECWIDKVNAGETLNFVSKCGRRYLQAKFEGDLVNKFKEVVEKCDSNKKNRYNEQFWAKISDALKLDDNIKPFALCTSEMMGLIKNGKLVENVARKILSFYFIDEEKEKDVIEECEDAKPSDSDLAYDVEKNLKHLFRDEYIMKNATEACVVNKESGNETAAHFWECWAEQRKNGHYRSLFG